MKNIYCSLGAIRKFYVIFAAITVIVGGFFVFGNIVQAATLSVDGAMGDDSTGAPDGLPYKTIQAAINAAVDGDIINVAAGAYTEQITINKSIDLIGAGAATASIVAPAVRAGSVTQETAVNDYVLAAYALTGTIDARVEGFTIDVNGKNKTSGANQIDGVFFRDVKDAGGTIAGLFSSTIHNFAATPDYEGFGIVVYGDSLLTLGNNNISDYTRDGISINRYGGLASNPNVTISGNTITGSAAPLNGINISAVTAGSITGNTITGNTRFAPWAAGGIVIWTSTGISVTGNHVNGNFYGIDIEDNSNGAVISGNDLADNIKRAISINNSSNNTVAANTITGPASGTDDVAIGIANNSTGNTIGGNAPADGNTITMSSSTAPGVGNLYAIHMDGSMGSGSNTIKYNTIVGGRRGAQFDGPPGATGVTTIANNTISGQEFGGITAYNNGDLVISDNTLTDAVRPIEFWGPVNVSITGNTINGSAFDGINAGNASGIVSISGNHIYNVSADNTYAVHIRPDVDNVTLDNNEIYNSFIGIFVDTGSTGNQITNNNIHDNTFGAMAIHEIVGAITGNTLTNNQRGIETDHSITAQNNSFVGGLDDYCQLCVYAGGTYDVSQNWWGTAVPASLANWIADNGNVVNYTPYYVDSGKTILNTDPSVGNMFFVDAAYTDGNAGGHSYGYDAFSTIQEAINNASTTSATTIMVGAGNYNESLLINKPLILNASGSVKPVIGGASATNYILKIDGVNGATINNFEINGGDGTTGSNNFNYGILVNNSGTSTNPVEIKNSVVKNIWVNGSNGIGVENSSYVLVHGNIISSFHKRGIRFINSSGKFYGNEVMGDNVDGTSRVQNLVNLWGGSNVEVYSNKLHNALTTPGVTPTWDSPGIFISSYGGNGASYANVYNNEIYDSDTGITMGSVYADTDTSTADITNNSLYNLNSGVNFEKDSVSAIVHGNYFSNVVKAINFSDSIVAGPAVNAENNWWGTSNSTEIANLVYSGVDYTPWSGGLTPETNISADAPEVIIGSNATSSDSIVNVPDDITNATLNVSGLLDSGTMSATLPGAITINATTSIGNVNVQVPAGITITGATGWAGVINVPQIKENSTVSVVPDSDKDAAVSSVLEVGYGDIKLTFDKAVRILIAGQAGRYVGYSRGGVFTAITDVCSANTQTAGDLLPPEGNCKIDAGSDLVIWTKHFTNFVTYTQSVRPVISTSYSSGGGGGGGGGGGTPTPIVTTPAPIAAANTPATTAPVTALSEAPAGQVLGASTFNFTSNLTIGSKGDAVTELQKRLTAEGVYSGPITGYFGNLTFAGVKAYQAKYGISQVGNVGPLTRAKLNSSEVAGASAVNLEAIQAQIIVLQAKVSELIQQLKALQ